MCPMLLSSNWRRHTFRVESHSLDFAVGTTLSQVGCPVAVFRKNPNCIWTETFVPRKRGICYCRITSWLETFNWKLFYFEVFTAQQAVSFIFDQRLSSEIKNETLIRWILEHASFTFDIIYCPVNRNVSADTLFCITGALTPRVDLNDLHNSLCQLVVTQMYHWVPCKNLPFSLEDLREVTNSCHICK